MIYYWNTQKKLGTPLTSVDPGISNVKKGIQYLINGVIKIGTYVPGIIPRNTGQNRLPNVSAALCSLFQAMVFVLVEKSVENGIVKETPTDVNFKGVWQPLNAQILKMKSDDQRAWSWFMVHSCTELELKPDDVIFL